VLPIERGQHLQCHLPPFCGLVAARGHAMTVARGRRWRQCRRSRSRLPSAGTAAAPHGG
jgi:hypothetical protein